jgi:hypothetical protein
MNLKQLHEEVDALLKLSPEHEETLKSCKRDLEELPNCSREIQEVILSSVYTIIRSIRTLIQNNEPLRTGNRHS